jgi:hypothetical protein
MKSKIFIRKNIIVIFIVVLIILTTIFFILNINDNNQNNKEKNNIEIFSLNANDLVSSPISISGAAQGWYFEGVFGVSVLDGDGAVLGAGLAHALTDWTTTSSVPFVVNLSFEKSKYSKGKIIFKKDNPSGLPKNDEQFILPVRFK